MKDYYKILGLTDEASDEEIRTRWIEMMKYHHPDLAKELNEDDRVKEINEAYQVLKNASTRMEYDLERDLRRSLVKRRAEKKKNGGFSFRRIVSAGAITAMIFLLFGLLISRRAPEVRQPIKPLLQEEPISQQTEAPKALPPAPEGGSKPLREAPVKTISKPEIPVIIEPPLKTERQEAPAKAAKVSPGVSQTERVKPEEAPPKVQPEPRIPAPSQSAGLHTVERVVNGRKESVPQVEAPAPRAEVPKPFPPEPPPVMKPEPLKEAKKVLTPEPPKPEIFPKTINGKESVPPTAIPVPKAELPRPFLPEPARPPGIATLPSPKPKMEPPVEKPEPMEAAKLEAKEKVAVEPRQTPGPKVHPEPPSPPSKTGLRTVERVNETVPTKVQEKPQPPVGSGPGEREIVAKPKEEEKAAAVQPPVQEPRPLPKPEPPAVTGTTAPPSPPRQEAQTLLPKTPSAKTEAAKTALPHLLQEEEEVRQFFAGYIERYVGKDVEGFLSFFSSGAIQNNKDRIDGMRKIYANFFDQSQELSYRLEAPKIEVYQNGVGVRARYEINQILKKGGPRKVWKGQARWVMVREEGKLKILSLSYRHD